MADRPRRSARLPAKLREPETPPITITPASRPRRKTQDAERANVLQVLLKSPKSALTAMDISDLMNSSSWTMLSLESQTTLRTLLPPTAFQSYIPFLDPDHPSAAHSMDVDIPTSGSPTDILDTSVFTDPHFLAAAHTFQDHIFSDWLSDSHAERVKEFQVGVLNGTLSAAWKDEVWEHNNRTSIATLDKATPSTNSNPIPESAARAGEAAEVRLGTLAKHRIIRIGDVVAYKRNFTNADLVIEKDVIVKSIHPKTYALTVLLQPGPTQDLPAYLLSREPSEPLAPTQEMTITSPTMLESGLLDIDGRVEKSKRPNGNAWKCFTIWRWRGDVDSGQNRRGGRENHGTLFYLRSSYYYDR